MLIGTRRALLGGTSYINKVLGIEPTNLVGLWPQSESSGSVSLDKSVHRHDGAYTGVVLGAAGVPGMGLTSPTYDGTNDYNNIYSADLANDNLLSNPGFEAAGGGGADVWANWVENAGTGALANETTIVHEGTDAAKVTAGGTADTYIYLNPASVVAGKKYRLRFWTRGDGSNAGRYRVYDISNSGDIRGIGTTGVTAATWTAVAYEFTAPAGCTTIRIYFFGSTVDTTITYFDAVEVRSMDGFLGDEGTLLAWAKVSAAGVWTDSTARYIARFYVDANNYWYLIRSATNNAIKWYYKAGGTVEQQETAGLSNVDFACYAFVWSKSEDTTIYYIGGAPSGSADSGLGTWVGDLASNSTVVGAGSTTPSYVWSGTIGPVALWNKALTADQIAYLSKV